MIGTSRSDPPGERESLHLDLTDPDGFERMSEIGEAAVDLLVCNAGVFVDRGDRLGAYGATV